MKPHIYFSRGRWWCGWRRGLVIAERVLQGPDVFQRADRGGVVGAERRDARVVQRLEGGKTAHGNRPRRRWRRPRRSETGACRCSAVRDTFADREGAGGQIVGGLAVPVLVRGVGLRLQQARPLQLVVSRAPHSGVCDAVVRRCAVEVVQVERDVAEEYSVQASAAAQSSSTPRPATPHRTAWRASRACRAWPG